MYANKVKKIAAVHDLSGMGRVSLTVVIPILSSMGFQVCPLPTAVLSNHTQYPGFSFLDLTDEMPKIIAQWKKLEVEFDAIYTGYLGSPRQIQIVSDFIRDFRRPDSLIVAGIMCRQIRAGHFPVAVSLTVISIDRRFMRLIMYRNTGDDNHLRTFVGQKTKIFFQLFIRVICFIGFIQ